MRISVFLTASCIARNSLRRASRVCASDSSAAFVIALGGGGAFGFGAIRRDDGAEASSTGVFEADRETPEPDSCGVALESSPASSFSSSANESLLFANGFFFFFFGGPSDGEALFLNGLVHARTPGNERQHLDSPVSHIARRRGDTP